MRTRLEGGESSTGKESAAGVGGFRRRDFVDRRGRLRDEAQIVAATGADPTSSVPAFLR